MAPPNNWLSPVCTLVSTGYSIILGGVIPDGWVASHCSIARSILGVRVFSNL